MASSADSSLIPPIVGPQRVLVVLATWGPQPFARDDVRRVVFEEVDSFYRASSYGKMFLSGAVTPWLKAFDGPIECSIPQIRSAAGSAARAVGYDPVAYERVVYIHPAAGCPWSGATQANSVYLNGSFSQRLVAHELGHAFGLPHANTTSCRRHGCPTLEYGDPYDTMGEGFGDFSAYAKHTLGWLARVAKPSSNQVYPIAALERQSSDPQAFVVTTARDQYWIEYRTTPARNEHGGTVAGAGVMVHVSPSPDLHGPGRDATRNVLLSNPVARGRPELVPGDHFSSPGAFTLTILKPAGSQARLRFKWTDAVAPRAPKLTSAIVDGKLRITLETAHETGSGVARYSVF
jgi:hypothetical protein